jgi:hypothetical protein
MARGDFPCRRCKVALQSIVVPKLGVSQRIIRPLIAIIMFLATLTRRGEHTI